MALSKQKFKSVADKLFTKARNGGLVINCDFELKGDYDPVTNTDTPSIIEQIECVRDDYSAHQIDSEIIQRNDFMLLARFDSFTTLTPKNDSVTVGVGGVNCSIVNIKLDAADAVYIMQVRGS